MPASNVQHIPTVMHFVRALRPVRILDVGIGNGTYGFLIRQYLDIGEERINPATWKLHIDGVDVFEGYRNPVWDFAYDKVIIGDIRHEIGKLKGYDLILFNDVLEHVELEEAHTLLRSALAISKAVLTTTPNREYPQGTWGGNDAERHRCLLRKADFPGLAAEVRNGDTTCFVCSNQPAIRALIRAARADCPTCGISPLARPVPRVTSKIRRFIAK